MIALLFQWGQPTLRFAPIIAGTVFNGATHQRIGANGNAVVGQIAPLHDVAEFQRPTPAAINEGGSPRVFADGDDELQRTGDVYRFGVPDPHIDRVVKSVGVVRTWVGTQFYWRLLQLRRIDVHAILRSGLPWLEIA